MVGVALVLLFALSSANPAPDAIVMIHSEAFVGILDRYIESFSTDTCNTDPECTAAVFSGSNGFQVFNFSLSFFGVRMVGDGEGVETLLIAHALWQFTHEDDALFGDLTYSIEAGFGLQNLTESHCTHDAMRNTYAQIKADRESDSALQEFSEVREDFEEFLLKLVFRSCKRQAANDLYFWNKPAGFGDANFTLAAPVEDCEGQYLTVPLVLGESTSARPKSWAQLQCYECGGVAEREGVVMQPICAECDDAPYNSSYYGYGTHAENRQVAGYAGAARKSNPGVTAQPVCDGCDDAPMNSTYYDQYAVHGESEGEVDCWESGYNPTNYSSPFSYDGELLAIEITANAMDAWFRYEREQHPVYAEISPDMLDDSNLLDLTYYENFIPGISAGFNSTEMHVTCETYIDHHNCTFATTDQVVFEVFWPESCEDYIELVDTELYLVADYCSFDHTIIQVYDNSLSVIDFEGIHEAFSSLLQPELHTLDYVPVPLVPEYLSGMLQVANVTYGYTDEEEEDIVMKISFTLVE